MFLFSCTSFVVGGAMMRTLESDDVVSASWSCDSVFSDDEVSTSWSCDSVFSNVAESVLMMSSDKDVSDLSFERLAAGGWSTWSSSVVALGSQ